jgi:hypothetical protein
MIRYTSSALACFAFSLASTGFAQEGGLALGARVGYALPMGKA